MATILFWNVGRKAPLETLKLITKEHSVDIIILAELGATPGAVSEHLSSAERRTFAYLPSPNKRLHFFSRWPVHTITIKADIGRISARTVQPPIGIDFTIVGIHFPSKLHYSAGDQFSAAFNVARDIAETERAIGHRRTIVLGDLNLDPFDPALVASNGFNAVMDRTIAARGTRTVAGKQEVLFYNPMWNTLGDETLGPAGTFYYNSGRPVNYYWHTFDQILVRPELLKYFPKNGHKVIYETSGGSLVRRGKVNTAISDHLPILAQLDVEGVANE